MSELPIVPLRPGFASAEQPQEQHEDAPSQGNGFDGVSDAEAAAIWEAYHLCLKCTHQHVCKWATNEEAPIVIARCLSFVARPV